MKLARLAALALAACALAGCGEEVVVSNQSSVGVVVERQDVSTDFFALAPGQERLVDNAGHANGAARIVAILDASCQNRQALDGDGVRRGFTKGGFIVVDANGVASYQGPRSGLIGGNQWAGSHPTCAEAAAALPAAVAEVARMSIARLAVVGILAVFFALLAFSRWRSQRALNRPRPSSDGAG